MRNFNSKQYNQYGNQVEFVSKEEEKIINDLILMNKLKIETIKSSKKCFGDKVRDIIRLGITDNIVYARKIMERI